MLAHEVVGEGDPLLLLHGTPSSRAEWSPVVPLLSSCRSVILVDLPGFGESSKDEADGPLPADWVKPIEELLSHLGLARCDVLGSSMGGWTALELARARLAGSVTALAPAGLWGKRSPTLTNAQLVVGQGAARLIPERVVSRALRSPRTRQLALRSASTNAGSIDPETASSFVLGARRASGWREHYRAAKASRFLGGQAIDVPVTVVWGEKDLIAPANRSRELDQLPPHTVVETWADCGHLLAWDAPDRVFDLLTHSRRRPVRRRAGASETPPVD